MKHLSTALLLLAAPTIALAQQPFARLGVEVKVLTLTAGRYPEFFAHDSLRRIGSVVYDTRRQRIAALLPTDSVTAGLGNDVAARWLSVDPLANNFANENPYNYVSNNPINKIDPDGRSGIATIDKKSHTVTVSSNIFFYGSVVTPVLAKTTAATIEKAWNDANGHVSIGGEVYKVKFKVQGAKVEDKQFELGVLAINMNTSLANNFIRVETSSDYTYGNSYTDPPAGANTGFWSLEQDQENGGTSAPHEYGHGVGLMHTDANKILIKRKPDMMMTEFYYNSVPPEYLRQTPNGIRLDATKRQVTQQEVEQIFTPEVKQNLQKNGNAGIGTLTNVYHPEKSN